MALSPQKVRANERIRSPQIRLIGAAGEQFGIVTPQEGMQRALEAGLDLVEVAATTTPPVCRIMDLGKYLYTLGKKEKESRKKQKVIDIKEVKMTTKIEDHDYQTKLRNARRFIERGDKVKLVVFFRGREIVYVDKGRLLVDRFIQDLSDIAMIERNDGLEGKAIQVYLTKIAPVKKKEASSNEPASANALPPKTE
ncbi:MAG TPA: translation initiation factor IF-3 [Candidatus Omnitrophota bacterium]|nr:translation initiation factor IF-3 [Candidatus Omnitrophota bacterium]